MISRSAVRLRLAGGSTFLSICFHPACLPSRQSCSGSESPCSWCILKGPLNCLPVISFSSFHCLIIVLFVYLFAARGGGCLAAEEGKGKRRKRKKRKHGGGGGAFPFAEKRLPLIKQIVATLPGKRCL